MTGRRPHILILEDSESDYVLAMRELALGGLNPEISWVKDRSAFLQALESSDPDVALLDHSLPGFDGISALKMLQEMRPDVPAIIVSGAIGEELAIETMKAGASDYVLKQRIERLVPVTLRALQETEQLLARRRAEEALLESRKRYEALFSSSSEGICVHELMRDESGRAVNYRPLNVNPALEQMIGMRKEMMVGALASDIYGSPIHLERFARVMETGESASFEDTRLRPGKTFLVSAFPIEPGNFATLVVDITYRKELEMQLEQRAEELARSNADLQQFAYVASHDLQEPLRMVFSYLALLEKRCGDDLDDRAKECIYYAKEGAIRARDLVQDLLEYSRVGSRTKPSEIADMERLLGLACRNLRELIREEGAVIDHDPLPRLPADEAQITALLQNLVSNAIKFHGPGRPEVRVSCCEEGGDWIFEVRDNGIGIRMEDQERIFLLFQRLHTREEYEGTGIGLAIAKKIVERHGGRIWVDSRPGEGSSFYFTLPNGCSR
mgnify:CR=1 FL=1